MAIYSLPKEADGRRFPDLSDTNDEAFSSIYRSYRPTLLAFCRSRLTDASEAEDACQETFLRVYRSLPRFDRTQRLWPWLATIAANVCTDMRRKKQALPLSACDTDPRAGRTIDPADELDARARSHVVFAALHELPEGQRRQVYLADAEGWSYADIATREQRSVASVRTSLMRGRSAFKARARAIAEDRGMWPLSAVLPFSRLRRLLGRTAKSSHLSTSAAPVTIGALQAAAAALVVIGTLVPVTGTIADAAASAAASTQRVVPTVLELPDRVDHDPAPPSRPTQLLSTAPADATTGVDLDGNRITVQATGDVGADPDRDPTVLGGVSINCGRHHHSLVCEVLTGDDGDG